jgi:hypothetical protein
VTNRAIATNGMTKLIQSDDVPCGLFFILSLAAGNKKIINAINAKAEIISIQSIIDPEFTYTFIPKQSPG